MPVVLAALVGLTIATTTVEVGWLVFEHVDRSAAVRRALETALVLRVCRAVHETQRERGLLSTYLASRGSANALELGQQFLRSDAALDLAVGAVLRHADTARPMGFDTDLSPKRTAALLGNAVDVAARRAAFVDDVGGLPWGGTAAADATAGLRSLDSGEGLCRRKACQRLRKLLVDRKASARRRAIAFEKPADHRAAFEFYSGVNDQLLTVARDARACRAGKPRPERRQNVDRTFRMTPAPAS